MELFKTPFSRAYWRCAVRDAKKTRTLVFSALMVAALSLIHISEPTRL